jgi:hypothetical protein
MSQGLGIVILVTSGAGALFFLSWLFRRVRTKQQAAVRLLGSMCCAGCLANLAMARASVPLPIWWGTTVLILSLVALALGLTLTGMYFWRQALTPGE